MQNKKFFGHPLGLLNLFSTEFCERFSYYGMRAILVFYIYATVEEGGLGLTKTDAIQIISLFGSSVYLLTIVGGWLADRVLSSYNCVFIGGIIIACGHICLGLPFSAIPETFIALALIAIGTGLLKSNVSEMVGRLYSEGDRRRDAGFNLFVMGINLGSLFSPFIVGTTQKATNYHIAFTIPAVVMIIALVIYRGLSSRTLADISKKAPHPLSGDDAKNAIIKIVSGLIVIVIAVVVLIKTNLLTLDTFSIILPLISLIITIILFATMLMDKELTKVEKQRVWAYIAIYCGGVIFWAIEELQSSVMATYADTRANNFIGSFEVPAAWYQSINPLVIVAIAPLLAIVWTKMKKQPSFFGKSLIGLALTGVAFVIPGVAFLSINPDEKISPLVLIIPIVLFSVGELFVSPIGLSATTSLAPKKYSSRMMSLWFLNSAVALGANAFTVRFLDEDHPAGFFFGYAIVMGIVVLFIALMLKKLKKLANGVSVS